MQQLGSSGPQELQICWRSQCSPPINVIHVSSAGKLAVVGESSIIICDGISPNPVLSLEVEKTQITASTFSLCGTNIVAGCENGCVYWWRVQDGHLHCRAQIPVQEGEDDSKPNISCIACSGAYVAVGCQRQLVIFGMTGEFLHMIPVENQRLYHLTWLSKSQVAACLEREIRTWTITEENFNSHNVYHASNDAIVTKLARAPHGKLIAGKCDDGHLHVWQYHRRASSTPDTHQPLPIAPILSLSEVQGSTSKELLWDSQAHILCTTHLQETWFWSLGEREEALSATCYMCGPSVGNNDISSIAFKQDEPLLATADVGGLCHIYDLSSLMPPPVAGELGTLKWSVKGQIPTAGPYDKVCLQWHPSGLLIVGASSGELIAMKLMAADIKQSLEKLDDMFQTVRPKVPEPPPLDPDRPSGWGGEPLFASTEPAGALGPTWTLPVVELAQPASSQGVLGPLVRHGRATRHMRQTQGQALVGPPSRERELVGAAAPSSVVLGPVEGLKRGPHMERALSEGAIAESVVQAPAAASIVPRRGTGRRGFRPPAGSQMAPGVISQGAGAIYYQGGMPVPGPHLPLQPVPYPTYVVPSAAGPWASLGPFPPPQWPSVYPYYHHYPYPTYQGASSHHVGPVPLPVEQEGPSRAPPALEGPSGESMQRLGTPQSSEVMEEGPSQQVPVTIVFVGHLTPAVDEDTLFAQFRQYGEITDIQVIRHKDTLQSRGYAFITYTKAESATTAMEMMNGAVLYGAFGEQPIRVSASHRCAPSQ